MKLQLGYACINMDLGDKGYKVNNSCIAKTVEKYGKGLLVEKTKSNLESVLKILEWNNDHDIYLYRMSSNMFPHLTNDTFISSGDKYSYPLEQFTNYFDRIGELADRYNQRITFHPSHFNQIGSPNPDVFRKTVKDLEYHADVLDLCHRDRHSVMVVHGGGTYNNKEKTKERWVQQFFQLPSTVRRRLVIENCERQYNIQDVLELSKKVNRPVVFDTHHHECYDKLVCPQKPIENYMYDIVRTWNKCGVKPKFHISEQAPDKRIGAHSDYVENIHSFFFKYYQDIDIMIEAKAKEKAVLYLKNKYNI